MSKQYIGSPMHGPHQKSDGHWAIFGTFDVDNYGDLLFPIVSAWRLNETIVACSPTSNVPSFSRDPNILYLSVIESMAHFPRAILIGGGNILHFRVSNVKPYFGRWFSYASLQVVPFLLKKYYGVPVCYNAPSICSTKRLSIWRFLFGYFFNHADYLGFRDCKSVEFARFLTKKAVYCTPDTAFDLCRVWPRLESIRPISKRYFVVHVNERYGGSAECVAMSLDKITDDLGIAVVLLPIGPCHGDIKYAEKVASLMSNEVHLVRQLDVYLFAQYIANSEMYLGSSMHGFISALSYGVKASLVLNSNPMAKFRGVISAAGFPKEYFFSSWLNASARLSDVTAIEASQLSLIHKKLDLHWNNIHEVAKNSQWKTSFNSVDATSLAYQWNLRILKCIIYVSQRIEKMFSYILKIVKKLRFFYIGKFFR